MSQKTSKMDHPHQNGPTGYTPLATTKKHSRCWGPCILEAPFLLNSKVNLFFGVGKKHKPFCHRVQNVRVSTAPAD